MDIKDILKEFKEGRLDVDDVVKSISNNGIDETAFSAIDTDRLRRTGIPEVIFGSGKTIKQVAVIAERMHKKGIDIMVTKASPDIFKAVKEVVSGANYNQVAQTIVFKHTEQPLSKGYIAIVAAGTSDIPVAEEAVETARFLNNKVEVIYDIGVAGIHRVFNKLDIIQNAQVIIVIAGMEGALASVIGGLVDRPVIGVPTSVGYGTNFGGLSALLSMLNSCTPGVSVVNIDNGFGAACQATLVNRL